MNVNNPKIANIARNNMNPNDANNDQMHIMPNMPRMPKMHNKLIIQKKRGYTRIQIMPIMQKTQLMQILPRISKTIQVGQ